MRAVHLHKPDGSDTGYLLCQECNTVFSPGNPDVAEKCCTCYDCGLPLSKDERVPYCERETFSKWKEIAIRILGLKGKIARRDRSLYHRKCEQDRRDKRAMEQLESAELVENYDGPVYCDGVRGSYGDGYCESVEELTEFLDDEGGDRPEFAFCCTEHTLPPVRLDSLIESLVDDMDDDASERLEGCDELQRACDAFNEANKGVLSWYEDRKHKVRVPGVRA